MMLQVESRSSSTEKMLNSAISKTLHAHFTARRPLSSPEHTQCRHCNSFKSPLWRRGEHGEMLCNACGLYWRNHRTMRPLDFILKPRSPSVATLLARDPSLTPAARNHAIEESRKLLDNAKCLKKMMQKAQNSKKTKKQLKRDTFKAERKDEPIDYASQSDDNWRPLPKKIKPVPNINARAITPPPLLQQQFSSENQCSKRFSLPSQLLKASIYSFPIKDIDIQLNLEPSERPFTANSLSSFPDYQASLFVNFQTYLMVDTVEYFGIRYNIGQIVAVKGKDGCIYYVEIRQLYLNEYNQKFFSFTWLHPSEEKASEEIIEKIEESNELHQFRRTSLHKAIESLDCIIGPIYD